MGFIILAGGTCLYFATGAVVLQNMEKELDRADLAPEWQDSRRDKVLKLLIWPFFAGAHYGFKFLLEDWFGK